MAMDKNQNKLKREEAIGKLARFGPEGYRGLVGLLDASDRQTTGGVGFGYAVPAGFVRWKAADTLGSMGRQAAGAAPRLAGLMGSDPVVQVRGAAAFAIGNTGSRDPYVIGGLKNVLKGQDYFVWQASAHALGQIKPEDQEAVDLLRRLAGMNANTFKDFNTSIAVQNAIVEAKTIVGAGNAASQPGPKCQPWEKWNDAQQRCVQWRAAYGKQE